MDEKIYNDELKVDLMKIKIDSNPETIDSLRQNLLKAHFIIPVEKSKKKDELNIALLTNDQDEKYFQAYTDIDAYNKLPNFEDYDTFTISFDQYAHALISGDSTITGLVINPFTENVPFNKDFIKNVFSSNKVRIEVLNIYPKKELKVIKDVLKEIKEVKSAYLFKMYKLNQEGFLLVVETSKEDNKRLFDKIGNRIVKNIDKINLEIGSTKDERFIPMIKDIDPIYKA